MKPKSEVQRRFEEIMEKKLNNKFISSGDLIRFRDACIEQGKQQAMKEELKHCDEFFNVNDYENTQSTDKFMGIVELFLKQELLSKIGEEKQDENK
jgi:hypothetical protein